ncbi:MAG: hypothetical protein K2N84_01975 [Clostridia bacterium]|nr:hypothetical protein [Clostridia bacterium]
MKKALAVTLGAALSLTMLAGCGDGDDKKNEKNTDTTISGVQTSATVMAGEEFDALAGVTAHDEEDGDLTSKINVEAVGLTFTDGKTTPTEASEYVGYEIIYTVTDSNGATATEYCTLYVKQAAAELENVFTSDFTAITPDDADKHWWDFNNDGADATATLKQGAYVVDVTDLKGVNDDKLMLTRSFADLGAGEYEFVVWASSSVATKINMNALLDGEDNWDLKNLGGGKYNEEVGTTVKAISHKFTLDKDNAKILFRICLGGGDRPNAFSFAVEKIAIYKTTGVEKQTDLYKKDSFDDLAGLAVSNAGDGSALTVGYDSAEKAAKIDVTSYNTSGGVWSVAAKLPLTGATVEKGATYGYEIVVKATNAHAATSEIIVAPVDNGEVEGRAFNNTHVIGAGETTIRSTFTANFNAEAPAIHFQIGKHDADTMTSNVILIKSVRFYKIEGDKKIDRVAQDKFILFGQDSSNKTNAKYPYNMFNGSDDGVGVPGIGTAYIENGKLVYKIHEGSVVGGQNKLVIGYWDNPINLPANAYYVVSIKIKSSASIGFDVCLHDMNYGGDEWDDGLLYRRAHWQNDAIQIGTTETTVEFTTDIVPGASKCELILEFGSSEINAIEGDVIIEISEIKIGVRNLVG